ATRRFVRVPLVVFEIVLGVLLGPHVLDWAHPDTVVDSLSDLGLSMLIFLAGYEIDFGAVRGDTLRRALSAWPLSLAVGIGLG
ncbi:cation:proton antiporter, partial [Streptomyces sp. SID11233]|nr:cation:proton antiporter [Streptomyces sp. SID11233]